MRPVPVPDDRSFQMRRPMIVALDPEHEDDAPLTVGSRLATATGAPLVVLGAYLRDPITSAARAATVDQDLHAAVLENVRARTSGLDADLVVNGGSSAPRVLHDAAVERGACLLVVGSSQRGA